MGKIVNGINLVTRFIIIWFLFFMVIAVFLQVVFRFVLDQPLAWTEELARYLQVWITFLGAAYAMSIKAHIGTDYILKYLSPTMTKVVVTLAAVFSIMFYLVMVQHGYLLSVRSMTQTSPTLLIPMGAVYSVIPISGVLLIINVLYVTWNDINRK